MSDKQFQIHIFGKPGCAKCTKALAWRKVRRVSPLEEKVVSTRNSSSANSASASGSSVTGVPSSNRTGSYTGPCGCAAQPTAVHTAKTIVSVLLFIIPSFGYKDKNN